MTADRFSWILAPAWDDDDGRAWCARLPELSATIDPGAVIHRGRNTLWRCLARGGAVVVKRFAVPRSPVGRLAARLRGSKATRSFSAAARLAREGFATPQPLAAVDLARRGRLIDCWYCCAEQPHRRTLRDAQGDASPEGLALARDVGAFVARLHAHGVLHRDLNATNVLLVEGDGDGRFSLIDLNRVRFARVGLVHGIWNLQRLGYVGAPRDALVEGYAAARGRQPGRVRACDRVLGALWRSWWRLKSASRPLRRRLGR